MATYTTEPVSPVQEIAVTLTASEFNNLRPTSIELLPDCGSGKFYKILSVDVYYDYGSAAFGITGAALDIGYGAGGDSFFGLSDASGFLDQAFSSILTLPFNTSNNAPNSLTGIENSSLILTNPGVANFTDGTGCTITIYINYVINTI